MSSFKTIVVGTDGSGTATEAVERYCGRRVRGVPGDTRNVEIRSPHDLFAAEGLLAALHYVVA